MALNETPYIHKKSIFTIESPALDLSCMLRTISYKTTAAQVDVETQCDQGLTAPGKKTSTLDASFLTSFDSADGVGDGLWNQLDALDGALLIASLKPKDAVVDSTNPAKVFKFYMPPIDFVDIQTIGDKTVLPLNFTTGAPITCLSAAAVTAAIAALS